MIEKLVKQANLNILEENACFQYRWYYIFFSSSFKIYYAYGIDYDVCGSSYDSVCFSRTFSRKTIQGWTSMLVSMWFIGGIITTGVGITGLYIGKIYTEVKRRPRYFIEERV